MISLFMAFVLGSVMVTGDAEFAAQAGVPAAAEQDQEAAQPEGIGSVAELSGTARAVGADGSEHTLAEGDAVFLQETIVTDAGSSVQIEFSDESLFTVSENTSVRMDEFAYDENAADGNFAVYVSQGVFRFITGKVAKAKPENVRVDVPSGTIGIRGTVVVGEIIGEECLVSMEAEEDTTVRHHVVVFNEVNGQINEVEINEPGLATVMQRGQIPQPVFQLPEENKNRFQQMLPPPQFLPRGEDGRPQHNKNVRDPLKPMNPERQKRQPGTEPGKNGPGQNERGERPERKDDETRKGPLGGPPGGPNDGQGPANKQGLDPFDPNLPKNPANQGFDPNQRGGFNPQPQAGLDKPPQNFGAQKPQGMFNLQPQPGLDRPFGQPGPQGQGPRGPRGMGGGQPPPKGGGGQAQPRPNPPQNRR